MATKVCVIIEPYKLINSMETRKLISRREAMKKISILGATPFAIALLGACNTSIASITDAATSTRVASTAESAENLEPAVPFLIGGINYGIEGANNGPLTRLTIEIPGKIRDVDQFILDTYPRRLSPSDTNPAGNYWENDNPTYLNAGGVVVQTIHSGYVSGKDLPANVLRSELQETGSMWSNQNVSQEEGRARRERFINAPMTIEQNGILENGTVVGIYHITPKSTIDLENAYMESNGQPVDLMQFSDYDGDGLDSKRDVIYFYCTEPYSDEEIRSDVEYYSQGRDLLVVRVSE